MKKAHSINESIVFDEIKYVFENYISQIHSFDINSLRVDYFLFKKNKSYLFNYLEGQYFISIKTDNLNMRKKNLIGEILSQMSVITKTVLADDFKFSDRYKYRDALYQSALLRGMIQWACSGKTNELVYRLIEKFSNWSIRTYERNHVKFGIIIQSRFEGNSETDLLRYLDGEISAILSDGEKTFFVIDKNGSLQKMDVYNNINKYLLKKLNPNKIKYFKDKLTFAPLQYENVGGLSIGENFGITLSNNGEICCFKNKQLTLARLNGKWTIFDYRLFRNCFLTQFDIKKVEELVEQIYLSCLDVAFAGTGGCIALISEGNQESVNGILPSKEAYESKIGITTFYSANFLELSREVRKELLAVDGACVLHHDGTIRAFGAIVKKVQQQKKGGARAAAAGTLSKFGIAIKISADGYIEIFSHGKQIM